jgi:hypothetical protein
MMSCMSRIAAGVASLICDGTRWLWLTLELCLECLCEIGLESN